MHKMKGLSLLRKKRKMGHMTVEFLQHVESSCTCSASTEIDCSSPCTSTGPEGTYLLLITVTQEQNT